MPCVKLEGDERALVMSVRKRYRWDNELWFLAEARFSAIKKKTDPCSLIPKFPETSVSAFWNEMSIGANIRDSAQVDILRCVVPVALRGSVRNWFCVFARFRKRRLRTSGKKERSLLG